MKKSFTVRKTIYGVTTIGEKGQVVVPADARSEMKLKKGEKLLVLGMGTDMIAFCRFSNLEAFASHLAERLEAVQDIIKKSKQRS